VPQLDDMIESTKESIETMRSRLATMRSTRDRAERAGRTEDVRNLTDYIHDCYASLHRQEKLAQDLTMQRHDILFTAELAA